MVSREGQTKATMLIELGLNQYKKEGNIGWGVQNSPA